MIVEKGKSEAAVKVKIGSESAREGKEKEKGHMHDDSGAPKSYVWG